VKDQKVVVLSRTEVIPATSKVRPVKLVPQQKAIEDDEDDPSSMVPLDTPLNWKSFSQAYGRTKKKPQLAPLSTFKKTKMSLGDGSGKCNWCSFLSQSDEDLKDHVGSVHVGIQLSRITYNEICGIKDQPKWSEHVRVSEWIPQRNLVRNIPSSSDEDEDPEKVKKIKPSAKTEGKPKKQVMTCDICSKVLPSGQMQAHTATHFPNQWKMECEPCKLVFSSRSSFDKHNLNVHGTSISVQQTVNKQSQKKVKGLRCHLCIGGKIRYGTEEELSAHHTAAHYERNYPCDLCSKVTVHWSLFEAHLKSHTRVDAAGEESCPFCDKPFNHRLDAGPKTYKYFPHLYLHMDPQLYRFKCNFCDDRFYARIKQQEHENVVHTGKAQFVCELCKEGFATSARRAMHKRTHHSD